MVSWDKRCEEATDEVRAQTSVAQMQSLTSCLICVSAAKLAHENGKSAERGALGFELACAEVDEAHCEEDGEDVEQPVLATPVASGEMEYGPRDDPESEAISDGVGERDQYKGEECGDCDQRFVPADLGDG